MFSPEPHPLVSLFARLLKFLSAKADTLHHLSLSSSHLLRLFHISLRLLCPVLSFLSLIPFLCKWFPGKEMAHFETCAKLPSGCPVAWQGTGREELLNSSTHPQFSQFVPIPAKDFYPPFQLSGNQASNSNEKPFRQAQCNHANTHTLRKPGLETCCST